jgi:hypothetical protein
MSQASAELALGPAHGRELAPEAAARVEVHRVVVPLGLDHGHVPVHHRGAAPVVSRPVQPHRQPVRVDLARGLAVHGELAHPARGAPLQRLGQAGVRHHELAVVQHVVRDEAVEEGLDPLAEGLGALVELLHGLGEPVRALDLRPSQRAQQLGVVVAVDRERDPVLHHVHGQLEHARAVGPPVHEVSHEDELAPLGVARRRALAVGPHPAELVEQVAQLAVAAVHVPHEIEGAALVLQVHPQTVAHQRGHGVDGLDAPQVVHEPEALVGQRAQRALELADVPARDVRRQVHPLGPLAVARDADRVGHVEHDGHGEHVVIAGELQQGLAGLGPHVGRVHHGELAALQALAHHRVQQLERVARARLVVLVVRHQAAHRVGRHDLGGSEQAPGQRGLAAARGADQHHQRELGDMQLGHRAPLENSAAWVGAPTSGSSGPMGCIVTL